MEKKTLLSLCTVIGGFVVIITMGIFEDFQLNETLLNTILMAGLAMGGVTSAVKIKQKRNYTNATTLKSEWPEHSETAKRNYTAQVLAQLNFLEETLANKTAQRNRLERWRKYRLPGLQWMINRYIHDINKTQSDINELKRQILELQRKGDIFIIIES